MPEWMPAGAVPESEWRPAGAVRQTPAAKPSAGSRFAKAAGETVWKAGRGLVDTIGTLAERTGQYGPIVGPATVGSDLLTGIWDASANQWRQDAEKPLLERAARSVPLIGPTTAGIVDEAEQTGDVARALGRGSAEVALAAIPATRAGRAGVRAGALRTIHGVQKAAPLITAGIKGGAAKVPIVGPIGRGVVQGVRAERAAQRARTAMPDVTPAERAEMLAKIREGYIESQPNFKEILAQRKAAQAAEAAQPARTRPQFFEELGTNADPKIEALFRRNPAKDAAFELAMARAASPGQSPLLRELLHQAGLPASRAAPQAEIVRKIQAGPVRANPRVSPEVYSWTGNEWATSPRGR